MTLPITPFLAADAHPLLRGTSRTLPGLRIRILLRSCLPVIVLLLPVLCVAGITDTAGVRALALGEDPGDLSSLENPESLRHITSLR